MKTFVLFASIFVCVGITSLLAAHWSDWKGLSICSAKPCMCNRKDDKCEQGKRVEVRSCIREDGDESICEYDEANVGPIKLNTNCRNKQLCPGWSEWASQDKCDCKTKVQPFGRFCNNPSPIHPDVLCLNEATGEEVKEQFRDGDCNCSDEEMLADETTTTTTTTTTSEPTTPLPWCCEKEFDYALDGIIDNLPAMTTTSQPETTKKPSAMDLLYYDMYDSIVDDYLLSGDCTPCTAQYGYVNAKETTTPFDVGGGDDIFN